VRYYFLVQCLYNKEYVYKYQYCFKGPSLQSARGTHLKRLKIRTIFSWYPSVFSIITNLIGYPNMSSIDFTVRVTCNLCVDTWKALQRFSQINRLTTSLYESPTYEKYWKIPKYSFWCPNSFGNKNIHMYKVSIFPLLTRSQRCHLNILI